MHIGNSVICPVTGIPMLLAAGSMMFLAFKNAKKDFSKEKILPTIALVALVFALQMINFSLGSIGSSGHIIGGVLLACLLGKNLGFLAICSILLVQALFFNDGGILAFGFNAFNMGFLSCYVAYPLFFETLKKKNKPLLGVFLASIVALELGAISAVLEIGLSKAISLSLIPKFLGLMQLIHLPIATVEGLTGALLLALSNKFDYKKLSYCFSLVSLILVGFISNYASTKPDGLEWSLLNVSDGVISQAQNSIIVLAQNLQNSIAILSNLQFGGVFGLVLVVALMTLISVKLLNNRVIENE